MKGYFNVDFKFFELKSKKNLKSLLMLFTYNKIILKIKI